METIRIAISRLGAMREFAKLTAYMGAKAESSVEAPVNPRGEYERVYAGEAEVEDMIRLWREACADTLSLVDERMVSEECDDYYFKVSLSTPMLGLPKLDARLRDLFAGYIISSMISKWAALVKRTDVEEYEKQHTTIGMEIMRMLNARIAPPRLKRD